ncbi:alanine acetyltransferase [Salinisphaera orenii YIM 95161]|uniref:Alanine acetyltransferase n=2 Tax=Salinisphaera TaxID=180541 RepID=A0A423PJW1_9GAMM|nr:alanine acetyltransferase [Salinisphaera halophila YIM 95161]
MIVMPRTLDTARLHLRPPVAADAPAVFDYAGDARVTRFLDWATHLDLDDSRGFIDDVHWGWESGDDFCWVLIDRASDALVGTVGCQFDAHGAQFGYVLAHDAWGRGLATEAMAAVFDAARDIDDVARFWATCDVDNRASARVLEKLGMREEGVLRRWSERPNHPGASGPRDVRVFAWVR